MRMDRLFISSQTVHIKLSLDLNCSTIIQTRIQTIILRKQCQLINNLYFYFCIQEWIEKFLVKLLGNMYQVEQFCTMFFIFT